MRAGLDRAATAILLADNTRSSSPHDIDGRTLLTALAVESTKPACYTCVEVLFAENVAHFREVGADELIVTGEARACCSRARRPTTASAASSATC